MSFKDKPPFSPFEVALAQSVESPQRQTTLSPMQRQNASKVIDEVTQAMVNRKAVNVPASLIRRDSSNNSNVSYTNYENSGQHQQEFNEEVPQESCIPQSNPSTSLKLYHMMSKSCGDENDLPHNNYQQHQ